MGPALSTYASTGVAGLRVVGELDLSSRQHLRALLAELVARDVERVRLDLTGVTFIDCGCMAELDQCRRDAVASGRRFEVTGASAVVVRVAELASYDVLASLVRAAVHS